MPLFSEDEMTKAIKAMKNGKEPGPEGIPAEVLKRALKVIPGILLSMFNACLVAGVFPRKWNVSCSCTRVREDPRLSIILQTFAYAKYH